MKKTTRLLLLALLCSVPALLAQDKEKGAQAEVTAKERIAFMTILTEAEKLADAGKEHKSPLMLVTAGGLFLKLKGNEKSLVQIKDEPTEEYEKGSEKGEAAPKEKPKDNINFGERADELFDAAEGLAEDDNKATIRTLIKAVKQDKRGALSFGAGTRGNVAGPQTITKALPGGATHVYHFHFAAGLPAAVGFKSSFPCQVTIVRSDNENVIAAATLNNGVRQWTPGGKGAPKFTIRVKNISRQAAQYQLLTN